MYKVKVPNTSSVRENVTAIFLFVNGTSLEATTNKGLYSLPRNIIQYLIFIDTYKNT